MNYKPKSDHPWRRYKDRQYTDGEEKKTGIKEFRTFIVEIAEGWDNVEILVSSMGTEKKYYLHELPQNKQAMWLSQLIEKHYIQR